MADRGLPEYEQRAGGAVPSLAPPGLHPGDVAGSEAPGSWLDDPHYVLRRHKTKGPVYVAEEPKDRLLTAPMVLAGML